jgi:hypothetical protein
VAVVALQAEEGLGKLQKIVPHRAMGAMTVSAVVHHVGMLIGERAFLLGVTLCAGFLDARQSEKSF